MTKCTKCNQEVYLSIGGDTCYHCFVTNSSAAAAVATTNNTTATTTIIDKDTKEKAVIKVQFFEDVSLITVQNQMNRFFVRERENISNILKIEYVKDKDSRYSVMVVYC